MRTLPLSAAVLACALCGAIPSRAGAPDDQTPLPPRGEDVAQRQERGAPLPSPAPGASTAAPLNHWWLWGETRPTEWTVQIEPAVWYMALGGDLTLGGGAAGGAPFSLSALDLEDAHVTPAGEVHVRADRLSFMLSAYGTSFSEDVGARAPVNVGGVAIAPGTPVHNEIDTIGADFTVGYEVWGWPTRAEYEKKKLAWPPKAEVRLDVFGGVRMFDMRAEVTPVGGAGATDSGFGVAPLLGARFSLEMNERFSVDVAVDYALVPDINGRQLSGFNAVAGFAWRPWGNVGVQLGYRTLFIDMEDGSFAFDGSLAGLVGSVVIRF